MSRLRTTVVALAVGTALVATGAAVASSAMATPAPVAAVAEVGADPTGASAGTAAAPADPADPAGDAATRTTPRAAARGWWNRLTDEQRSCLQSAHVTRPVGPLDDAERAALRTTVEAAAQQCQVTLPHAKARAFWNDLSDEQRTCLQDADVTRPWGPLTKEERQQVRGDLRAAAQQCGVTLPARAGANAR